MAEFNAVKSFILSWEGGFSNHPNDKGGPTNKGVTWSVWKDYAKKKGFTPTIENLKAITEEQWDEIFRKSYWDPWKASQIIDQPTATMLVDWGYNSGVKTVIKNLQRYLGVVPDGVVGPKTLGALNDVPNVRRAFEDIKSNRKIFLDNIVKRNKAQKVFYSGWMRRVNSINYDKIVPNK